MFCSVADSVLFVFHSFHDDDSHKKLVTVTVVVIVQA